MDRLRVSGRELAVHGEEEGDDPLDWLMARAEQVAPSSEDQAFWRAAGAQLLHCLDALPEPQRAAFLLHHEDGASVEDLAQRLALPFETARSRLRYALKKLRGCMGHYLPALEPAR
jgi:RNA polymerase sigma-70 factor (ECF subfamily)